MIPITSLYSSLLLLLTICSTTSALSSLQHASIDFSSLGGRLSLFGDFDGLSFFNTVNASEFLTPRNPGTVGLFLFNSTSSAISTGATLDGEVFQTLQLSNDTALLMGNFSRINGAAVPAPAIFNMSTGQFYSIWPQTAKRDSNNQSIQGNVYSALLDDDLIYIGGDFVLDNNHSVAVYNLTSQSLQTTPFEGFGANSVVKSIARYAGNGSSKGSIVFGGEFDTLGLPELLMHNITYNVTGQNTTNVSLISAEQLVSLKFATFTSINGIESNSDSSLVCPSPSNSWSLADKSGGQWAVELPGEMKGLMPTKARIYLPDDSTNGIKTFRLYTYPNGGIMNLSYVDPTTNELTFCDAWCPLLQAEELKKIVSLNKNKTTLMSQNDTLFINSDGSLAMYNIPNDKSRNLGYGSNFQEFAFVNEVGMDKIGLTTIAWYGDRGELSGFELFQNQIRVYSNNSFNEPTCGPLSEVQTNHVDLTSGNWQSIALLNNAVTSTNYLVSVVENDFPSITFYPNILYSGSYSLFLYTPGCSLDGSCLKRGIVNATVINANGTTVATKEIFQNNLDEKYDFLFFGHLNASSTSGQTQIQLDFISSVEPGQLDTWMVADKVVANIVLLDTNYANNTSLKGNRTKSYLLKMKLNGLFEYSLSNFSTFEPELVIAQSGNETYIPNTNTFVGNSTINVLSGNLTANSSISQVFINDNTLSLLGYFASSNTTLSNNNLVSLLLSGYNTTLNETLASLLSLAKRDTQDILGLQFNDSITSLAAYGDGTILLGQFSINGSMPNLAAKNATTQNASNFAFFQNNQLYSFGNTYQAVNFSQFSQIVIEGIEYFVFASEDGFYTTWDNTNRKWLALTNVLNITSSTQLNDLQLVSGSSFVTMSNNGTAAAFLTNNTSIQNYDFDVTLGSVSAAYYVNSSFSVIGGNFGANPSISHIAILQNSTVSPIFEGGKWGNNSVVSALYVDQGSGLLYVGCNGSVQFSNPAVTGVSVYSLKNNSLPLIQPPSLSLSNGLAISVNALAYHEGSKQLLVGGHFDLAGSLACGVVCLYDTVNTRWLNPQSSTVTYPLSGTVTDAKFVGADVALLSGLITFNNTQVNFVTYNFASGTFSLPSGAVGSVGISGESVTSYIINDSDNSQLKGRMVAIGQNFVSGFNGSSWNRIDSAISYTNSTILTDLKLVQLNSKNANNTKQTYFNSDKALILSGSFNLEGYGNVNVALFDGESWSPYIFTLSNSKLGLVNTISFQDIYRLQSSTDIEDNKNRLSVGQVVGISLACALGSTALLGFIYIIPLFFLLREAKKKETMRKRISEDDMMNIIDPSDLLHEMDIQRHY